MLTKTNKVMLKRNSINNNTTCKNNECDIMTYLTDYVTPIMQILSVHLPDYHMKLRTTKCLNTSIMTMYLLLGTTGLKKSEYCSVNNIKKRITDENITRLDEMILFDKMINDLFKRGGKYRYFYYIMITDGEMVRSKNSLYSNNKETDQQDYFPGHVFVIEKIPCGNINRYKLYQSYINQYTLSGHYQKNNNSMEVSEQDLKDIFGKTGVNAKNMIINSKNKRNGVSTIFMDNEWNKYTTHAWEKLTYVPSEKYNGFSTNNLKFCYQKVRVLSCYKILLNFVDSAIKKMNYNPNIYILENPADPQLKPDELFNILKKLKKEVQEKYNKINVQNLIL